MRQGEAFADGIAGSGHAGILVVFGHQGVKIRAFGSSGSVDAIWVYYAWAGIACEVAGLETDYFSFADIDPVFDYYSPVIIANNAFLSENPDVARDFLAALAEGYQYGRCRSLGRVRRRALEQILHLAQRQPSAGGDS